MSFRNKAHGLTLILALAGLVVLVHATQAQNPSRASGPDPREIPVPAIKTAMKPLPGVRELPVHLEMPDVLTMSDGKKVTNKSQWLKRREQMKRILEYYAVGIAPPA